MDEATEQKRRLEERQRGEERQRAAVNSPWTPKYFSKKVRLQEGVEPGFNIKPGFELGLLCSTLSQNLVDLTFLVGPMRCWSSAPPGSPFDLTQHSWS